MRHRFSNSLAMLALLALAACGGISVPGARLLGGGAEPRAADVARGATLPFGQVGRVCGLSASQMGTEVDTAPGEGKPIWRLFDTAPGSTGQRTHYLTGFGDGCARQLTAALILFGSPSVHETHKSGAPGGARLIGPDAAYEAVKSRVCGTGPGGTCPEARLAKLERSVVFISAYPDFGGTGPWYELLLDGDIVLADAMGHN